MGNPEPLGNPPFHDSRYGTECEHGHGWYFFEDGCDGTGCENAPTALRDRLPDIPPERL